MSGDFTVRLLDDEATREKQGRSTWIIERDGAQLGQIVHEHNAERRDAVSRAAWFTVRVDHDDVPVHARDFGAVLKRAIEMLAQPKPTKRTKGARR